MEPAGFFWINPILTRDDGPGAKIWKAKFLDIQFLISTLHHSIPQYHIQIPQYYL